MKISLSDFIRKSSTSVSLTEVEKANMRAVLSEYMAMKPVRVSADANKKPAFPAHSWYALFRRPVALALLVALVASGAGVSYAAEGALPGDMLYPVKVSVNEPIRGVLASTPEAKAVWNVTRAERRLAEAGALAAEDKLTPQTENEIAERFSVQADAATAGVSQLERSDSPTAISVASDFETELAAHAEILDTLSKNGERGLRKVLREKALAIADVRAKAESAAEVSSVPEIVSAKVSVAAASPMRAALIPAPQPMMVATDTHEALAPLAKDETSAGKDAAYHMGLAAKKAVALALKLSVRANADAESGAQVNGTIADAQSAIANGDAAFADASYSEAFHDYQDAFVSLKKLSVFLGVSLPSRIRARFGNFLPASQPQTTGDVSRTETFQAKENTSVGSTPLPPLEITPAIDTSGSGKDGSDSGDGHGSDGPH